MQRRQESLGRCGGNSRLTNIGRRTGITQWPDTASPNMGHNLPYRTTIPAQPTTPHHTIASYVRPRAPTHRPQSWWCCTTQGWGRHHLGSGTDTLFDANSKPHILPPPPLKTDMFQQINIDHFYKTKMRHASHLRDVICSCRSFCRN